MPKKLLPIELEDITRYRIPSSLHYGPAGSRLAFDVTRADPEKNDYHTDVYVAEHGSARRVTWNIDANVLLWEDEDTLILRRTLPDAQPGLTQLFRLSLSGGEARPWLTLLFVLNSLKKLGSGYIATGRLSADDPDAYLDSEEQRKKKSEARKQDKDYHIVDEVPYWFNGAGYTNGRRTSLFQVTEKDGKPVCRRLTAPLFSVDSFCVDGDSVYYTGISWQGKESLYNRLYVWHASSGKTECLWRKSGLSFGSLFVLNRQLYVQASDMKAYGVNQTPDIFAVEGGRPAKGLCSPGFPVFQCARRHRRGAGRIVYGRGGASDPGHRGSA